MKTIRLFVPALLAALLFMTACQAEIPTPDIPRPSYKTSAINLKLKLITNDPLLEEARKTDPNKVFNQSDLRSDPYTSISAVAQIMEIKATDPYAYKLQVGDQIDISLGDVGRDFFDCQYQENNPPISNGKGQAVVIAVDPGTASCQFNKQKFTSSPAVNLQPGDIFRMQVKLFSLYEDFSEFEIDNLPETIEVSSDHIGDSTRQISLYYYNLDKDKEIADYIPCSEDAVLPVVRKIPLSGHLIEDAINLLLQGQITAEEKDKGFQTEFPHSGFELLGSKLEEDGTLKLTFSEVPGFTDGGSCRIGILIAQIRKTAEQFPEVQEIQILPEELFQP